MDRKELIPGGPSLCITSLLRKWEPGAGEPTSLVYAVAGIYACIYSIPVHTGKVLKLLS